MSKMEQYDAHVTARRLELPVPGVPSGITLQVNGEECQHTAPATETLTQFLRNRLGLTGLKTGCGEGECGACTVLINDQPVNSCLVLAFQVEGRRITTIEGLENADGTLSALQQAFIDYGAVQCGYCIPGMVIASEGLLRRNSTPDDTEIRRALAGNICRCTGFLNIIKAVKSVASAGAQAVPE